MKYRVALQINYVGILVTIWSGDNLLQLETDFEFPTRGIGTLDLVLINFHINLHKESIQRPPHGL